MRNSEDFLPNLESPYPHSESWTPGYTWSIGLKWRPLSNYPITLDWKLWFVTQWILDFPRWKLILSRNMTRSWWLRHLQFMSLLLWNFEYQWWQRMSMWHKFWSILFLGIYHLYRRTARLPWKSPPLYVCHCPFDSFDSQPALTSFKGRASWSSFEFQTSEYCQFHHFFQLAWI